MTRSKWFDLEAGTTELYEDPAYYDYEYEARREDIAWYVDRYVESGGPVLELGVGTARIARRAVRRKVRVVGLDLSQSMLAQAARRREGLPKARRADLLLFRADMREFALRARFPLVTCPFNAFQHLYTRQSVERCLARVREHLAPGGQFILDVLMPDLAYLNRSPFKRFPGARFKHPSYGDHYLYAEQTAFDPVTQINQMRFIYDRAERFPNPDAPETVEVRLSHRYFFPEELEALLWYNGFATLERLGDFAGGPLRADCESQVVVATLRRDWREVAPAGR